MTNAKEMNRLADEARKGTSIREMRGCAAQGTIGDKEILCRANPMNTNGRQSISLLWYINGQKVSKAKVAAL